MVKKERQRYILFKIYVEGAIKLEKQDFLRTIWRSIWRYFGMKEANKIGLWLLELNLKESYGILRCSNTTKEIIITALTMIKEHNNKRIILAPIKTSATIRKIRTYAHTHISSS